MKDPVDHIFRPSLPWRCVAITECGYDASKVKTITRDEFFQREKELGKQRAAMLTCMTCSQTALRWKTWDDDPRQAMQRELEWELVGARYRRNDRGQKLKDELMAIASLIEAHRDEFDEFVSNIEQRRVWLEKKAAMETKPKSTRGRLL
jgi:hypothetical protein